MSGLLELAERVEKLTGPCREVDDEIRFAVRARFNAGRGPSYTASLEAAMTLWGDWDHMEVYRPDHQTLGWTVHLMPNANLGSASFSGFARTHALAHLAASLRALASGTGGGADA